MTVALVRLSISVVCIVISAAPPWRVAGTPAYGSSSTLSATYIVRAAPSVTDILRHVCRGLALVWGVWLVVSQIVYALVVLFPCRFYVFQVIGKYVLASVTFSSFDFFFACHGRKVGGYMFQKLRSRRFVNAIRALRRGQVV